MPVTEGCSSSSPSAAAPPHPVHNAPQIAPLIPLLTSFDKLSWDNLVESHDRWSEEVIALCALAGQGVLAALQQQQHQVQASPSSPVMASSAAAAGAIYTSKPYIRSATNATPASSKSHTKPTPTTSTTPNKSTTAKKKNKHKSDGSNTAKSHDISSSSATEVKFTEYDDKLARAIIILSMERDIRNKFGRFIRVATTARHLFNGIAILKEAVAEGQAHERESEGCIPETDLHAIRMKALAMAEEMDWSSTNIPDDDEGDGYDHDVENENENDDQRSFTLFRLHRWIFRSGSRKHH